MSDFLGKLGSVVGIGVGSIELQLVKRGFDRGETVHGRLVLTLKEPVEARRIVVGVEASESRLSVHTDAQGHRHTSTSRHVIHHFEQSLEGPRIYRDDAWDFHLPLPGPAQKLDLPDGMLGDIARVVQAVASAVKDPPQWRVFAFLDIPWKANLKGSVDIVVR